MEPRAGVGAASTHRRQTSDERTGLSGSPTWVVWTTVAFVATGFHVLIDAHLGLFGELSSDMSVIKGLWALSQSALFGWWMLMTVLAAAGNGAALRSSLVLTGLLALTLNGVVAIAAAPPVSDAAPWQDLAHLGAIVGGVLALRSGITELRDRGSPRGARLLAASVVLLLTNMAFSAPLNLQALAT